MARVKAYQDDLAYIHDTGFGDFARQAAPALLARLRRAGIREGLVVDLGCGSGIWAGALCDAGYRVVGVDISPAMIRLARRHAPRAQFRIGSLLDVDLPPCVAVTALGECFNYLFDHRNSLDRLRRLFRRIYAALEPGGLLIFDVAEPGRGSGPRRIYLEGPGWAVLREHQEDPARQRLTRWITTFRRAGRSYRRSQEVHHLQLLPRTVVTRVLRACGFKVRRISGYGRQRFPKGWTGIAALKPGR